MPPAVAALLLTGGASRRLGTDKAEVVVDGEQLATRTARLLAQVAHPVLEVGPGYTSLPRVDDGGDRPGPLAAVAAGAAALVRTPGVAAGTPTLVVAVDMPGLTAALLDALAQHPSACTVVPVDAGGHLQVLCARYSADALGSAHILVAQGRRAMAALRDGTPYVTFGPDAWEPLAGADAFADVDTPDDLARLRR